MILHGSKVYCIKDYFAGFDNHILIFKKNCYYKVYDTPRNEHIEKFSSANPNIFYITLYTDASLNYFFLKKQEFEEHFYTEPQLRKLKLNRINEIYL